MRLAVERKVSAELVINGEVVDCIDTITMVGLDSVASCLGAPFSFDLAWMPFIAVGQGENGPSTEDRTLETEKWRKRGTVTVLRNAYIVQATFGINEPTDAYILREVGMFDRIVNGKMAARWVTTQDYNIAADDEVIVICTIYIA